MSAPGNATPPPSAYQQAIADPLRCIQSGCSRPAVDGKDRCHKHYKAARRADRAYKKRRRARARRKKLCTRCALRKRLTGLKWCATCCARTKRLRSVGGDKHVYIARSNADGFAVRMEGDGYGRERYHGQGKRGRQPTEQLDAQDMRDAKKHFQRAVEALDFHNSEHGKVLPIGQRREIRDAADVEFNRAFGFVEDIWARHRYSRPTVEKDED